MTYTHIELNGLSSLNVLIRGAPKVWRFIHPADVGIISEKIEEAMAEDNVTFDSCDARLVHKPGSWIPMEVLKKLGIRFCTVIQRPGDVVYVGPEVPHCVMNLGYNVAHAVLWTHRLIIHYWRRLECNCPETDLRLVCLNNEPVFRCPWSEGGEVCDKVFKSKSDLEAHQAVAHLVFDGTYYCRVAGCNSEFSNSRARVIHESSHSSLLHKCKICKFLVKYSNRYSHESRCKRKASK